MRSKKRTKGLKTNRVGANGIAGQNQKKREGDLMSKKATGYQLETVQVSAEFTEHNARVVQVIQTYLETRGEGAEGDPVRRIEQYWTFDGKLLFERDPLLDREMEVSGA